MFSIKPLQLVLALSILSIVIVACSASKENARAIGKAELYMPLAVGNQWSYDFDAGDEVLKQHIKVVGKTEQHSTEWFQVETTFEGTSNTDTSLMRTLGNLLILYLERQYEEIILIDFGRTEVDSVELSLGYVRQQDQAVEVGMHTFQECVVVASGHVDAEVGTYARGIGLIESWWFRGKKQITSAHIDGKEFTYE